MHGGGVKTSNTYRSKANGNVREFLDDLVAEFPEGEVFQTDSICRKVNKEDNRRRYNNNSISALIRERNDVERTPEGWRKIKPVTEGGLA